MDMIEIITGMIEDIMGMIDDITLMIEDTTMMIEDITMMIEDIILMIEDTILMTEDVPLMRELLGDQCTTKLLTGADFLFLQGLLVQTILKHRQQHQCTTDDHQILHQVLALGGLCLLGHRIILPPDILWSLQFHM